MTSTTGIKLDPETKARLIALAAARDRSPHWLMKHAILDYLEREEIYEREKREDEERWQEYQRGEYISHKDMQIWMEEMIQASKRKAGE